MYRNNVNERFALEGKENIAEDMANFSLKVILFQYNSEIP